MVVLIALKQSSIKLMTFEPLIILHSYMYILSAILYSISLKRVGPSYAEILKTRRYIAQARELTLHTLIWQVLLHILNHTFLSFMYISCAKIVFALYPIFFWIKNNCIVWYLEERAKLKNLNLMDDIYIYLAIILFIATAREKNKPFLISNQWVCI